MKTIGELDEDDADVVHHREQHLAEVLGLPLLARRERNGADLGDPLDDVRDLGAEVLLDLFDRGQRVFDDVVQQPGGDGHRIEPHVGQNAGHLERMHQVGLPRMPDLSLVLQRGEHVGPAKELPFLVRGVCSDPLEKVFESNHYLEAKSPKMVSNLSIGRWLEHSKASLTWVLAVHILGGFFSKIPRYSN